MLGKKTNKSKALSARRRPAPQAFVPAKKEFLAGAPSSVHVAKPLKGKAWNAKRRQMNFVRENPWGGKECKGESYGGCCCSKEGFSGVGAFVSSCRETA
jgi:hypothetical protein